VADTILLVSRDTTMKSRMWVPIAVFLAGVACIVVAAATGEAQVQLLIIFPLISGTSWLFILGVMLIIASFVLGFVFAAPAMTEEDQASPRTPGVRHPEDAQQEPRRKARYGGVVLIGPVPIVFGSDRNVALIMLVLAIVLIVVVLAIALLKL